MKRTGIYVTSFCNFAHDLKDGAPIEHECYVIPPAALNAERDGCDSSNPEWQKFYNSNRRVHSGRKAAEASIPEDIDTRESNEIY